MSRTVFWQHAFTFNCQHYGIKMRTKKSCISDLTGNILYWKPNITPIEFSLTLETAKIYEYYSTGNPKRVRELTDKEKETVINAYLSRQVGI